MPKNIIVFSDGTGNSAAKLFKTNVWRLYQALDLTAANQIASYDDGVGTSSVKVLAALGGAFGWGLKRNVLTLYKFLCRNYCSAQENPDKQNDAIYGFGFSRGAFTIRRLIGLVASEGLVTFASEEELDIRAAQAYRAFRKKCRSPRTTSAFRALRDGPMWLLNEARGIKHYDPADNKSVEAIRFLGLWDTVDAYGMPIRELKDGIDRYLWPLTFNDLTLSPKVTQACHALALDDERATFHPLVWDDSKEKNKNRIRQVWFAGVHANVGGGYANDALAHVPLMWIIKHAAVAGLTFKADVVGAYEEAANPFGKLYDSRAGAAAYYRYAPRRVDEKGYPERAQVHESVFRRMATGDDGYAPISLAPKLDVVVEHVPVPTAPGISRFSAFTVAATTVPDQVMSFAAFQAHVAAEATIAANGASTLHATVATSPAAMAPQRGAKAIIGLKPLTDERHALVLDTVWWRRVTYWLMLSLTAVIAFLPWLTLMPVSTQDLQWRDFGDAVADFLRLMLPVFLESWLTDLARRPITWGLVLVVLAVVYYWHRMLQERIRDRARQDWQLRAQKDRLIWFRQSRRRWRFWSLALLLVALGAVVYNAWVELGGGNFRHAVVAAVLATAFFFWRRRFDDQRLAKQKDGSYMETPGVGLSLARWLRRSKTVSWSFLFTTRQLIPFLFASAIVLTGVSVVNAVGFGLLNANGKICRGSGTDQMKRLAAGESASVMFDTADPCFATAVWLDGNAKYRIDISGNTDLKDGGIDVVDFDGFSSFDREVPFYMAAFTPLRRILSEDWFKPVARVSHNRTEEHMLGQHSTLVVPNNGGELFLYVNDAIVGLPRIWNHFYANNVGTATIAIHKVEEPPSY